MRNTIKLALMLATLASAFGAVAEETISVETLPPVVVRTVPESGAIGVDASLSEIRVTFSKDMMGDSWSLVRMSKDTFPELTGVPGYLEDGRTCVFLVKLEPGRSYAIWFNSDRFRNFKDRAGLSAIPYLLAFDTRD